MVKLCQVQQADSGFQPAFKEQHTLRKTLVVKGGGCSSFKGLLIM